MTNQELIVQAVKFIFAKPNTPAIRKVTLKELMLREYKALHRTVFEPGQTAMLQDLDFWWEVAYSEYLLQAMEEYPQAHHIISPEEKHNRSQFMHEHSKDIFERFMSILGENEVHLAKAYGITLPLDLGIEKCTNA